MRLFRLLFLFYPAFVGRFFDSWLLGMVVKEKQAMASKGNECPQFESLVSENVIAIGSFGNR
jgi:hypothetical protein